MWEAQVPLAYKKPRPHDSHAAREKFIRAKYQLRLFLAPEDRSTSVEKTLKRVVGDLLDEFITPEASPVPSSVPSLVPSSAPSSSSGSRSADIRLREACKTNDVAGALWAIAHGADVSSGPKSSATPPRPSMPPPSARSSSSAKISSRTNLDSDLSSTDMIDSIKGEGTLNAPVAPATSATEVSGTAEVPLDNDEGNSNFHNSSESEIQCEATGAEEDKDEDLSPLHLAVLSGSTACAVLLIMNGADRKSCPPDRNGLKSDIGGRITVDSEKAVDGFGPAEGTRSQSQSQSQKNLIQPAVSLIEIAESNGHEELAAYLRRKFDSTHTSKASPSELKTVQGPGSTTSSERVPGSTSSEKGPGSTASDRVLESTSSKHDPGSTSCKEGPESAPSEKGSGSINPEESVVISFTQRKVPPPSQQAILKTEVIDPLEIFFGGLVAPVPPICNQIDAQVVDKVEVGDGGEDEDDLEDFYAALMSDCPRSQP